MISAGPDIILTGAVLITITLTVTGHGTVLMITGTALTLHGITVLTAGAIIHTGMVITVVSGMDIITVITMISTIIRKKIMYITVRGAWLTITV